DLRDRLRPCVEAATARRRERRGHCARRRHRAPAQRGLTQYHPSRSRDEGTGDAMDMIHQVAIGAGLAWASGIRLYAVLFLAGILGWFNVVHLPSGLHLLMHPVVLTTSGCMFLLEFFADKIPGFDSIWDAIHTFIRIPAGALLAAATFSDVDPAWMLAAGLIGGTIATGAHLTKAGTRAVINTSPEPFTNWMASFGEEIAVLGGLW